MGGVLIKAALAGGQLANSSSCVLLAPHAFTGPEGSLLRACGYPHNCRRMNGIMSMLIRRPWCAPWAHTHCETAIRLNGAVVAVPSTLQLTDSPSPTEKFARI